MENADLINAGKQLVALIKYAYFGGNEPKFDDYKKAFTLAKSHSVLNLFHLAVKDLESCGSEVKKVAEKYYLANTHQQVSQLYYTEEIYKNFREKSIKFLPLKGYYVRKMYKSEDMRTSCDVDFYYDENDDEKLFEDLQKDLLYNNLMTLFNDGNISEIKEFSPQILTSAGLLY